MKDLVIFGNSKIAEVISYYAINECNYNVVAFTVDKDYVGNGTFNGLPVIPFDEIDEKYPPENNSMFIALGYQDLNRLRQKKYEEAKSKGYKLVSIIPQKTHIPTNVKIGENCFIMPPAIIHPLVAIGNNTFVWSGAMIGHHTTIGEHCWLTSTANISGVVNIENNSFFAVNATVGHGVNIGEECFLGANALVTKNLKSKSVVIEESTKLFRLDSTSFLKFSSFSNL